MTPPPPPPFVPSAAAPSGALTARGRAFWQLALLAAVLVLLGAAARPFYGLTADDAYISLRYALNWASGCGPVYNCGQPPVEGYTNFLWVALEAGILRLGADPLPVMRAVGVLCGGAALVTLLLICRRLYASAAAPLLPLLVLATSPFWAVNLVQGLETAAATLSVLVAALLSLDLPAGRRRPWLPGLAWGVSYLIRPEAVALAALSAIWSLLRGLHQRLGWRRALCPTLAFGLGFLAVAAPYFSWRVFYYGALFPNTFEAKQVPLAVLLPRNAKLLAQHPEFFAGLLAVALLALLLRRSAGQLYLSLLALVATAISLSVHNNFWMPGHRLYLTPIALLLAVGAGIADFGHRAPAARRRWLQRAGVLTAIAGAAVLVSANAKALDKTLKLARMHYARDDHPAREMGLTIRELARPGDWLITRDAGMVPYFAGSSVNVLDIHEHSLNDRHIARRGWDLRYILKHQPRFVILMSYSAQSLLLVHPVEGQISRSAGFRRRYRQLKVIPWNAARHFFLYQRVDEEGQRVDAEGSQTPPSPPGAAGPVSARRGSGIRG